MDNLPKIIYKMYFTNAINIMKNDLDYRYF